MFGAFEPNQSSSKKRKAETDIVTLEKEVKGTTKAPETQKATEEESKGEESDGNSSIRDEDQIMKDVEELIKVKDVENSTLKIGYNESDYEIKTQTWDNCIWEYICPTGYQPKEKFVKPKQMEKQYKFKLDKFQEKAVECIQKNESVLVAAHTSAGKTAIAEYAIAKSLNNNQRVIYTSPIKALSNQKYREL